MVVSLSMLEALSKSLNRRYLCIAKKLQVPLSGNQSYEHTVL